MREPSECPQTDVFEAVESAVERLREREDDCVHEVDARVFRLLRKAVEATYRAGHDWPAILVARAAEAFLDARDAEAAEALRRVLISEPATRLRVIDPSVN